MPLEEYIKIEKACKEADLILIGIGEKFQYDWTILQKQERFMQIEEEINAKGPSDWEMYKWIIPFLQKMALDIYPDELLLNACRNLIKLISDCNYFIISMAMDDYLYRFDIRKDRIVTPCGGLRMMQCDRNCCGEILDVDSAVYDKVKAYYNKEIPLKSLQEPVCTKCGHPIRFNQFGVSVYAEEGYLSQWAQYTKWLQGTVNRKVCVLELGVGLELPNLIRWPFERIVFYNHKAMLYRVHPTLYQVGENLEGRGVGICQNPIEFMANRFVK